VSEAAVTISLGELPVLEYSYADVPRKPYVKKLYAPSGINVLRDAPPDHLHHHGLMFAIGVNGVDFWSEDDEHARTATGTCGSQMHRGFRAVGTNAGSGRATFTQLLDWIDPAGQSLLLKERRTIEACREVDPPVTLITWRARLEPGGNEQVTLGGPHYMGLGMRLVKSVQRSGEFFNPDGDQGKHVRNTERMVRSRWCAYTAAAERKPITVAVFDHPDNPRHPAQMLVIARPYAFLSATLSQARGAIQLKAGQWLKLRYGVAVSDRQLETPQVERLYRRWLSLCADDVRNHE
jgi:hypothetical protein